MQTRGQASAGNTLCHSLPLYFYQDYWTGAETPCTRVGLQGMATAAGKGELMVFSDPSNPNDIGGDGVRTEIAAFTEDGLRDPGNYPSFAALTDGATVTLTCSKTVIAQRHTLFLGGDRTLAFSSVEAGMSGTIFVTQDGTGTRLLTLPTNSAKQSGFALSTDPLIVDRLDWIFDGSTYFWEIKNDFALPLDADASAFLTDASITAATTEGRATNRLVTRLKAEGLWGTGFAAYPFVGGTDTAHALDLIGSYNGTFGGGYTNDANGYTGNGTTGYFQTGFAPSAVSAQDDLFAYVYCRTEAPDDTDYLFGAIGSDSSRIGLFRSGANLALAGVNANSIAGTAGVSTDFRKHLWCQRISSSQHLMGHGNTFGSPANVASLSACDRVIAIGARQTGAATRDKFSTANIAFAWFGTQLDATQRDKLFEIVDEFQTAVRP
jgi:hypothetical protein